MQQKHIKINESISFGNNLPLVFILGPCQMESRDHAIMMVEKLLEITTRLKVPFIFKSSFDKANLTSISGKRGIGLDSALKVFDEIRSKFKVPTITDVHKESDCQAVKDFVDIIQIPAFLCRQTDLLIAAAKTGKVINVKKGQFLSPNDAKNICQKLEHCQNSQILLTERGSSFGYNNLVVDMRGLAIMSQTGYPVIIDATHSTQAPGGLGNASGGDRKFAPVIARSAVAVGIAGIFAEVHQDPDNAPSDGPIMIKLHELETMIQQVIAIDKTVKSFV